MLRSSFALLAFGLGMGLIDHPALPDTAQTLVGYAQLFGLVAGALLLLALILSHVIDTADRRVPRKHL